MKKKAIVCMLLCTAITFTCACSNSKDKSTDTVDKKNNTTTEEKQEVKETTENKNSSTEAKENDNAFENTEDTSGYTATIEKPVESSTTPEIEVPAATTETAETTEPVESTEAPAESTTLDPAMKSKVKDYIFNGQGEAWGANQLKWVENFFDVVDVDSLYAEFVSNGGAVDDVKGVAEYITVNAPVADNWEEMFKENFYNSYGQYPSKIEYIDGISYQAYAEVEGKEVPYVVVNARTGYWHG